MAQVRHLGETGSCLITGMADAEDEMFGMTEGNSLERKRKSGGVHSHPSGLGAKVVPFGKS